ncbi:DUF1080 domain-containing protein [Candidatus Latescibacterota bacterium]
MTRCIKIMTIPLFLIFCFFTRCGKGGDDPDVSRQKDTFPKATGFQAKDTWKILTTGRTLDDWIIEKSGSWEIENGTLAALSGGFIWTKEQTGNFILDCEFKINPRGNSGIFIRTGNINDPVQTGIEIQILDSTDKNNPDKHDCGAVYDLLEPATNAVKSAGEWNHIIITCNNNLITVVLNGVLVIGMNIDEWITPERNPDGTRNKFIRAIKDFPREGHIGFQGYGDPVWFRNIKIKEL